ncbi:hypothetical protein, partial [Azospirillum argentinense]
MPLRHYVPSFAAALVGIGLTVFVFGQERQQALDVQRAEFTRHADSVAGTLQRILSSRELIPTVFGGLFSADQDIQRGDLAALAERVFARMPSLVAVSWLPRTPPSQAGALLEALRQEGYAVSYRRRVNASIAWNSCELRPPVKPCGGADTVGIIGETTAAIGEC